MKLHTAISQCWLQEMSYNKKTNVLQQDIWAIPFQFRQKASKIEFTYTVELGYNIIKGA
jgi:hypothetical protein